MSRTSLTVDDKTSKELGKIAKKENRSKIGEVRFLIKERKEELEKPHDSCSCEEGN